MAFESQLLLISLLTAKNDAQNLGGERVLLSIPSPSYRKGSDFSLSVAATP